MIDYSTKELRRVFYYSTGNPERDKLIKVNGRHYIKMGQLQAITFVGLLYKLYDTEKKRYVHQLHIGFAKQNENDMKNNREIGEEVAMQKAMIAPDMILSIENRRKIDFDWFADLCQTYTYSIKRGFVKTSEEIKNIQK